MNEDEIITIDFEVWLTLPGSNVLEHPVPFINLVYSKLPLIVEWFNVHDKFIRWCFPKVQLPRATKSGLRGGNTTRGGHESDEDLKERDNKPFQVQKGKLVGGWSSLLGDKAQIPDILPHSGAPFCLCVEWNQLEIQQSTLQSFLHLGSPCCFPCSSHQVIYGRNRFLAPPFISFTFFQSKNLGHRTAERPSPEVKVQSQTIFPIFLWKFYFNWGLITWSDMEKTIN